MSFEIILGRWMALCAHPVCAWQRRSLKTRVIVVISYFGASYAGVLLALLAGS